MTIFKTGAHVLAGLMLLGLAMADTARGDVVPSLEAHSAEFEKELIEVTDGVWQAVGYGLANSTMIEGEDGIIIVDVMESIEDGQAVLEAFRTVTDKPIAALIYTHNHADHSFGGRGFVPEGEDVPVYAHATTEQYINRVINILRPAIGRRSSRMFGTHLEEGDEGFVNAGIGPRLGVGGTNETRPGIIRPTHTFTDRMEVTIAGIDLELVHAPGETNDQIFIWVPSKRLLLPGDNIYKAFPNLYTIRGTPYRDVMGWVRSLDRMLALKPEYMALGHTRPMSGEAFIRDTITAYRDAIQFVHDQTIRGINQDLTPDEIVEQVKLPRDLAEHPYLIEHYGTVEWSVRSIYSGYIGWFGGDAAFLSKAPVEARAEAMMDLAGGVQNALEKAKAAFQDGKYRWVAELTTYVLQHEPRNRPAKELKAKALRQLGYASVSPNGRNYYLTQALELEGKVEADEPEPTADTAAFVKDFPIANILAAMPVNLVPDQAKGVDRVMGFRFSDTGEEYTLHVRNSVAVFREGYPDNPDIAVKTETGTWVDIVLGQKNLLWAIMSGNVEVETGMTSIPSLLGFLSMFRQ